MLNTDAVVFCGAGGMVNQPFSSERKKEEREERRRREEEGRKEGKGGKEEGREGGSKRENQRERDKGRCRNTSVEQQSATFQIIKWDPPPGGRLGIPESRV